MNEPEALDVKLHFIPGGASERSTVQLWTTDQEEERLLYTEKVNLESERSMDKVVQEVCTNFPQLDSTAVKEQLQNAANKHALQRDEIPIDGEQVTRIRPSFYANQEFAAIVVPTHWFGDDNQSQTAWQAYIQYENGDRERVSATGRLQVEANESYGLCPCPCQSFESPYDWPIERRKAWLDGSKTTDPSDLIARLILQLRQFIRFPGSTQQQRGWSIVLSLWVLLTYVVELFSSVPYLRLAGPTASGKTRVLDVLELLCFRAVRTADTSAAVLYRVAHDMGPTILVDEAEALAREDKSQLLGILNAGYKRGGKASRIEKIGDKMLVQSYHCYGCKAYAGIERVPPTLANRSILLRMFRSKGEEACRPLSPELPMWSTLRSDLHELVLHYGSEWTRTLDPFDTSCPFQGRGLEIWGPLFALARWFEDRGETGLVTLLADHAASVQDMTLAETLPDRDRVLLECLADWLSGRSPKAKRIKEPRPSELLEEAERRDRVLFKNVSAHAVAATYRKYQISTHQGEKHIYTTENLSKLRLIEQEYDICLNLPEGTTEAG